MTATIGNVDTLRDGARPLLDAAEEYLEERQTRGEVMVSTAVAYRSYLRSFDRDVGHPGVQDLDAATMQAWWEVAQHATSAAISLSIVRGFCRWLVRKGELASDPSASITTRRKTRPKPPVELEPDVWERPDPATNPTLTGLVIPYLNEKRRRQQLAKATIRNWRCILGNFSSQVGDMEARLLTEEHVEAWRDSLTSIKASSQRTSIVCVRLFVRWLVKNKYLRDDPTLELQLPRLKRRVPRGLSRDQVAAVIDACPTVRERLMVMLMCQEGLRCIEVSRLTLEDIDFHERTVLVHGKGDHERMLPVSDETWALMEEYLAENPAKSGPLVRNNTPWAHGQPLTNREVSRLTSKVFEAAGVKKGSYDGNSAHALRHTCATDMLRNGAHLLDVQATLGHASLSTTQVYLPTSLGPLRQAMGGRSYGGDAGDDGGRK